MGEDIRFFFCIASGNNFAQLLHRRGKGEGGWVVGENQSIKRFLKTANAAKNIPKKSEEIVFEYLLYCYYYSLGKMHLSTARGRKNISVDGAR